MCSGSPKFAIVCGDLVHAMPSGPADSNSYDPAAQAAQVADFKHTMSKIDADIPLVCLCGNHDLGNLPVNSFDFVLKCLNF